MVTFGPTIGRLVPGLGPAETGLPDTVLRNAGQLLDQENDRGVVASGLPTLDGLLPAGGVRRGSLIEWLAGEDVGEAAAGAVTLACAVACRLAGTGDDAQPAATWNRTCGGTIVVIDRMGWFHPPAVLPWLAGRQLVVVRPSRDDDEVWAIDQALRCPGVAAVLAWPRATAVWSSHAAVPRPRAPRPGALQQWTTAMRRWQLAARGSGAVGLIVRSATARREPSWAEARITVTPLPSTALPALLERRLRLTLVGGAWLGRDPGAERSAEVVFDLMRGVEPLPRPVERGRRIMRSERPTSHEGVAVGVSRARAEGGASCRAS